MTRSVSPAARSLWENIQAEPGLRFGPMFLSRCVDGVDLRHHDDAGLEPSSLRPVAPGELRPLVQTDCAGRFRPNKASPNLVRGWRHLAPDPTALEAALDDLLPGGLADWHATRTGSASPMRWQDYADRQTGLYRNVGTLHEPEAEQVALAGCHARCCTRRRLWTIGDRPPEPPLGKSEVPCLEPCALVLELARRAQKSAASEERSQLTLTQSDLAVLDHLFDLALDPRDPTLREGDLSEPLNPRRVLLLREKLLPWLPMREWLRRE